MSARKTQSSLEQVWMQIKPQVAQLRQFLWNNPQIAKPGFFQSQTGAKRTLFLNSPLGKEYVSSTDPLSVLSTLAALPNDPNTWETFTQLGENAILNQNAVEFVQNNFIPLDQVFDSAVTRGVVSSNAFNAGPFLTEYIRLKATELASLTPSVTSRKKRTANEADLSSAGQKDLFLESLQGVGVPTQTVQSLSAQINEVNNAVRALEVKQRQLDAQIAETKEAKTQAQKDQALQLENQRQNAAGLIQTLKSIIASTQQQLGQQTEQLRQRAQEAQQLISGGVSPFIDLRKSDAFQRDQQELIAEIDKINNNLATTLRSLPIDLTDNTINQLKAEQEKWKPMRDELTKALNAVNLINTEWVQMIPSNIKNVTNFVDLFTGTTERASAQTKEYETPINEVVDAFIEFWDNNVISETGFAPWQHTILTEIQNQQTQLLKPEERPDEEMEQTNPQLAQQRFQQLQQEQLNRIQQTHNRIQVLIDPLYLMPQEVEPTSETTEEQMQLNE